MSDGESVEPRDEPLDPVAFAEKWFEDHPEVLDKYNRDCNYHNKPKGSEK